MTKPIRTGIAVALVAVVGFSTTACQDFLGVRTPNIISAEAVNPVEDAPAFSNSAWQNFQVVFSSLAVYTGWFTNEMRVGDTFPTRNEYGRRLLDDRNGTANGELWFPLSRAVKSAEDALVLLDELPASNINIGRLYLTSAFSALHMAEAFCTGVINSEAGGWTPQAKELTTEEMLDFAIARFNDAIGAGTANGTAAGTNIAHAARIGLARANLYRGNNGQVAQHDAVVPADFVFNAVYVDDPSFRTRLGNTVHAFSGRTANRESGVVGPEWRELGAGEDVSTAQIYADQEDGDERVSWRYEGRTAQDGVHPFAFQITHDGWNAPLPVATRLELDYLIAQAAFVTGNTVPAVTLITARRAENDYPPFTGTTPAEILEELIFQKNLDFWLTNRRMADWRWGREVTGADAGATQFIIPRGNDGGVYYKPELGEMGEQTCFPLPWQEYSRNDDIPRS